MWDPYSLNNKEEKKKVEREIWNPVFCWECEEESELFTTHLTHGLI